MKKIIILLYIFIINLSLSFAINLNDGLDNIPGKENPVISKSSFKRVFTGGDIGVTFGDYTEVRISPMLGYRFSPQVSGGLQFTYKHSWDKVNQNSSNEATIQTNTLGGNVFLNYHPIPDFYLKAQFEYDSYKSSTTQNTSERIGVPFLFLGFGYTKSIAPNVFLNAGIKVDVLNNVNSPFKNFTPFFDVGISIGI